MSSRACNIGGEEGSGRDTCRTETTGKTQA